MQFVNLTPHVIAVHTLAGAKHSFPPSGTVARVSSKTALVVEFDGIPINSQVFGAVENLPPAEDGKILIVSALVLGRVEGRIDVVAPDSGSTAIRENGQIVAVRGFVCR